MASDRVQRFIAKEASLATYDVSCHKENVWLLCAKFLKPKFWPLGEKKSKLPYRTAGKNQWNLKNSLRIKFIFKFGAKWKGAKMPRLKFYFWVTIFSFFFSTQFFIAFFDIYWVILIIFEICAYILTRSTIFCFL